MEVKAIEFHIILGSLLVLDILTQMSIMVKKNMLQLKSAYLNFKVNNIFNL